jgi:hypothetical protein
MEKIVCREVTCANKRASQSYGARPGTVDRGSCNLFSVKLWMFEKSGRCHIIKGTLCHSCDGDHSSFPTRFSRHDCTSSPHCSACAQAGFLTRRNADETGSSGWSSQRSAHRSHPPGATATGAACAGSNHQHPVVVDLENKNEQVQTE